MVKRVFATQITSVIARGKLLAEIRKIEEAGYATNPLLRADIKRAEKRIAQDDIAEFMVLVTDKEETTYSLHDWFLVAEPMLLEQSEICRTKKLNRAHKYISSGVFKDGSKFTAVRL